MINKVDYRHPALQKYIDKPEDVLSSTTLASSESSEVFELHLRCEGHGLKMVVKAYGEHSSVPANLALLLNRDLKHIVRIMDFKQQRPAYVSMQLCQQDLKQRLTRQKESTSLEEKLRYIRQIASGLLSLKSLKLMHGDVKPENILLDPHNSIKIADIDYVLRYLPYYGREDEFQSTKIRMGTLPYMAPEVLSQWKSSYASDIWSLGIVIYEIYFGFTPFPELEKLDPRKEDSILQSNLIIKQKLGQIRKHIEKCLKESMDSTSDLMLESMLHCLVWEAASRKNIQDIIRLLQGGKGRRKFSQSTDYSALHYQDDLFILPNTGLLSAFQELNNILSYLPEEASKFKDIQTKAQEINQSTPKIQSIRALKRMIELKYQKMSRVFQRLSKIEGGVDYSKKGQLFAHLACLSKLLEQEMNLNQWVKQNSVKSAEQL